MKIKLILLSAAILVGGCAEEEADACRLFKKRCVTYSSCETVPIPTPVPHAPAKEAEPAAEPATEPVKEAEPATKATCCEKRTCDVCLANIELIEAINAQRVHYGLPALTWDAGLVTGCRVHSWRQWRSRGMWHASGRFRENIAIGYPTIHIVTRAWMGSGGHRATILSRSATRIGAARYRNHWTMRVR